MHRPKSNYQKNAAIEALSWLTCAIRPLTTLKLQHALAIELGEKKLDEDNLRVFEDIIPACAGLVTVRPDATCDIVQFVNHTTQE